MLRRLIARFHHLLTTPEPETSSMWVIDCEERQSPAIVEVLHGDSAHVADCSCWRDGADCGRTCVSQIISAEQVRVAFRAARVSKRY